MDQTSGQAMGNAPINLGSTTSSGHSVVHNFGIANIQEFRPTYISGSGENFKALAVGQDAEFAAQKSPSAAEFLETLEFREMDDREDMIASSHAQTFEWLLEEVQTESVGTIAPDSYSNETEKHRRSIEEKLLKAGIYPWEIMELYPSIDDRGILAQSLQDFLKTNDKIFWFRGNPGCGKSTLMKAFLHNERMKYCMDNLLTDWARGRKLLRATFFFAAIGTDMQKSHLGFLQSIVHQLLEQHPLLINSTFSKKIQREAVARAAKSVGTDVSIWSLREMMNALDKILCASNDLNFYFHIDGVDEMKGSAKEMAKIILDIKSHMNVKVLFAGRHAPEIESLLEQSNIIDLHEVTRTDIFQYTIDSLLQSDLSNPVQSSHHFSEIIGAILSEAQGIFLWVRIVLESLLEGSFHFEHPDQLLARLRDYPQDLDQLYWFLLENVQRRYRAAAAFWLLIVQEYQTPSTINSVSDVLEVELAGKFDPADDQSLRKMYSEARASWNALYWRASSSPAETPELSHREHRASDYYGPFEKEPQGKIEHRMIQRMRAQCPHFFTFTGSKRDAGRSVHFIHRTVLDFLAQDVVSARVKQWLPNGCNVREAFGAVQLVTLLSGKSASAWSTWEEFVRQFEKIIRSYRSHGIESGLVTLSPTLLPKPGQQIYDDTAGFLTMTLDGWYLYDLATRFARMAEGPDPLRAMYAMCDIDNASETAMTELLKDKRHSSNQRIDFLLNCYCMLSIRFVGYGEFLSLDEPVKELRMTQRLEIWGEHVPSEIDSSKLWSRVLEYFRLIRSTSKTYPGLNQPRATSILDMCALAKFLVQDGADSNTLCSTVWVDPDKSLKAPMVIFKELMLCPAVGFLSTGFDEGRVYKSEVWDEVGELIKLLENAGGREFTVPAEDHQKQEVRILNISDDIQRDLAKRMQSYLESCQHAYLSERAKDYEYAWERYLSDLEARLDMIVTKCRDPDCAVRHEDHACIRCI